MAAGVFQEPGAEFGPCKAECKHRDCAEMRFITSCSCRFCGQPIGYNTRYYMDPEAAPATPDDERWVHATCLENHVEDESLRQVDEHEASLHPRERW